MRRLGVNGEGGADRTETWKNSMRFHRRKKREEAKRRKKKYEKIQIDRIARQIVINRYDRANNLTFFLSIRKKNDIWNLLDIENIIRVVVSIVELCSFSVLSQSSRNGCYQLKYYAFTVLYIPSNFLDVITRYLRWNWQNYYF